MATALSLVQLLHLHIAALGRYQGLLLKQAFLLGMQFNKQHFAKKQMCFWFNKFAHNVTLQTQICREELPFQLHSIQKLLQLASQDNTLISVSGADQVVLWNETE